MSKTQPSTVHNLKNLLDRVQKSAEAHTEPGSIGGTTSHPSGKAEDQTEAAQTGARANEYTSDIKKDQGTMGVESAGGPPESQESVQENIGPVDSKSTGKDPSNETSSVKGTKEDPGTSHPATTEDGEKYGSIINKLAALQQGIEASGKEILLHYQKQAHATSSVAPGTPPAKAAGAAAPATTPATADENVKAAQAGYDLAGVLADIDMPLEDKQACDHAAYSRTRDIIQAADYAAIKVAEMLFGLKQAEEEGAEHEEHEEGGGEKKPEQEGGPAAAAPSGDPALGDSGMPSEEELLAMLSGGGGGGDPTGAGGGGEGGGGPDLAALQALLGGGGMGGGGAEGGMPPGAGGGMPPGGDPMGGGGMPPGGDPMGGGGMPPGGEGGADPQLLQQILAELQVPPEQAAAKVAAAMARKNKSASANKLKMTPALQRRKEAFAKMLRDVLGR
jgi:hypothetical protein